MYKINMQTHNKLHVYKQQSKVTTEEMTWLTIAIKEMKC